MPRIKRARKRVKKLARKRARQRKRFRESKIGSRARVSAKSALARLKKLLKRATELLRAAKKALVIDWNGHEPIPDRFPRQRKAVRWVLRQGLGVYVSSTFRRTSGTYHGPALGPRAVDLGSDDPTNEAEGKAQDALLRKYGASGFLELFGPRGWYVKNGVRYEGHFPNHDDHTHFVRV